MKIDDFHSNCKASDKAVKQPAALRLCIAAALTACLFQPKGLQAAAANGQALIAGLLRPKGLPAALPSIL